jgi:hypothetical protein
MNNPPPLIAHGVPDPRNPDEPKDPRPVDPDPSPGDGPIDPADEPPFANDGAPR